MTTLTWLACLSVVCVAGVLLKRLNRAEEAEVSSAWLREQIRRRGVRGWSGAYPDED